MLLQKLIAIITITAVSTVGFMIQVASAEDEKRKAMVKIKTNPEITRFKGLGEISPDEFKFFIGDNIKLDPVMLDNDMSIDELLQFYMGKNTPDRQSFIIII